MNTIPLVTGILASCISTLGGQPSTDMKLKKYNDIFPAFGNRKCIKEVVGYGFSSTVVIGFSGDRSATGTYLTFSDKTEFFPNFFDIRREERVLGRSYGSLHSDIAKMNHLVAVSSMVKNGEVEAKLFISKLFCQVLGFGNVVESATSLGKWRNLVDHEAVLKIKPVVLESDVNGTTHIEFTTLMPTKELAIWSFKIDERGMITEAHRTVLQQWSFHS